MGITIRDVAREAGVSISTVSKALNNRYDVKEDTRRRIIEVAERLGYVPSSLARGLVSGRSRNIGVVITNIASPLFSKIVQGIEQVAREAGYSVLLCSSEDNQDQAMQCLASLTANNVEGVIITPTQEDSRDIEYLKAGNRPFILLFRRDPDIDTDYIVPDHIGGAHSVTKHLLDLGHRRIAHVGGPEHIKATQERHAGYRKALEEAGIPYDDSLVRRSAFNVSGGYDAAKELLSQSERPTAIYAASDLQAIGAIKAAQEMGIAVPDQLAVAGSDDIPLADHLQVPLTTFDSRAREIGARAAEILLAKLEGELKKPQHVVFPTELVVRRSSGDKL